MTNTNGTRRRLLLDIPSPAYSVLQRLAKENNMSPTQLAAEVLTGSIFEYEERE